MSKLADEMLRDIEKDTVDWDPNFDETRKEPKVLPSRFPNLLVNGSSGIAVGMATNIPPHNLREVINAVICVLDDPEAQLSDLMEHIKGPDFPTRGIIMGRSGIRSAYATGRGRLMVRARHEFEEFGKDRVRIVITEIPYQVNKRMLIKNMADQVEDKRLEGISDIRDESDRNGMRIVIELKRDANPQVVLNRLFAQTQLQTTFAINMLALVEVNGKLQPRILSLRHILDEYIAYQEQVLIRRTRFDLKKAQERAHLLEGLLIAEDNIDAVIKTIRESYDEDVYKRQPQSCTPPPPASSPGRGRRSSPDRSGRPLPPSPGFFPPSSRLPPWRCVPVGAGAGPQSPPPPGCSPEHTLRIPGPGRSPRSLPVQAAPPARRGQNNIAFRRF